MIATMGLMKEIITFDGSKNFKTDAMKIPDFKVPVEYSNEGKVKEDIPLEAKVLNTSDAVKIPDFETSNVEDSKQACMLPRNGGEWEGESGDSTWKPNPDEIPKSSNSEGKTWGEIFKKYDITGITFKEGYPDFSGVAEETVEINDFSDNRNNNFNQAEKKTAEKWNEEGKDGRTDWKGSEVKQYRKDNSLTWHECEDTKTMQLVPSEVHNNIPHTGGISVIKQENKDS